MSQQWVGKTIGGRYAIESLLGQGGMSAVYRATDPNLRRPVAVKLIHPHLADDPSFIGRFQEEAAAVARLRHPNIVQVHDFNADGDIYYMVLEYLVGETLQARLKRLNREGRRMPISEAVDLTTQICDAAGYAHNHELVHRDIKPANIMLDLKGQAILMDFGIVKIVGGDYHTATGATIGTAMYMSPEQIRSERITEQADIYSLGVTLYEMLSGQPPYNADSAVTLMMMVINDPLPDLRVARPEVPAALQQAIEKALAKEPQNRYQTMAAFAADLRALQDQLAEETGPAESLTQAGTSISEAAPPAPPAGDIASRPTLLAEETESPGPMESIASRPTLHAPTVQGAENIASLETVQASAAVEVQAAPETSTPAAARPARTRLVLAGIALLALVAAGLFYTLNQREPALELRAVPAPESAINMETLGKVVNLGDWDTGAPIQRLILSPNGSQLATAHNRDQAGLSQYRYFNATWDLESAQLIRYLTGPQSGITDLIYSPDGSLIGSVSDSEGVSLWNASDGSLFRQLQNEDVSLTCLEISPNNRLLAAGSWDGVISLWDIQNGRLLRTFQGDGFGQRDLVFSPDGSLLIGTSENGGFLVWLVSDGQLLNAIPGHDGPVTRLAISPDGTLLATASEDRSIKIWRFGDFEPIHDIRGTEYEFYDMAFSPDSSLLATGASDGTLQVWWVENGELLTSYFNEWAGITGVVFSRDGRLLISGSEDGRIEFRGLSEAIP